MKGHEGVDDEVDKSDNSDFGNDELFFTRKLKIFIMWDFKRGLPPITACMLSHL